MVKSKRKSPKEINAGKNALQVKYAISNQEDV